MWAAPHTPGYHFGMIVIPCSWTAQTPTQWVVSGYNAGNLAGSLIAVAYCR